MLFRRMDQVTARYDAQQGSLRVCAVRDADNVSAGAERSQCLLTVHPSRL